MEKELIHLNVYLCSDGTLMAYNPDATLNLIYTSLTDWSTLHEIFKVSNLPSKSRKGLDQALNIKYVKYYFKSTSTNSVVEIPKEHIKGLLSNIKG